MPLGHATTRTRTYVTNDCLRVKIMPSYVVFTCADGGFYMTQGDWTTWHRYQAVGFAVFHMNDCNPSCAGARSIPCVGRSSSTVGPDAPISVAASSRERRSRLTAGSWAAIGIGRNCPAQREGVAARVARRHRTSASERHAGRRPPAENDPARASAYGVEPSCIACMFLIMTASAVRSSSLGLNDTNSVPGSFVTGTWPGGV